MSSRLKNIKALNDAVDGAKLVEKKLDQNEFTARLVTEIPVVLLENLQKSRMPFTVFARMAILEKAKKEGYLKDI